MEGLGDGECCRDNVCFEMQSGVRRWQMTRSRSWNSTAWILNLVMFAYNALDAFRILLQSSWCGLI
jgi:hypothetical protein